MSSVQINLNELLKFYDVLNLNVRRHASSIKAISGEEMNLALLIHYLRSKDWPEASILEGTACSAKKARLDAWVYTGGRDPRLYQVEVKNWSVHGYGGEPLAYPNEMSPDRWRQYLRDNWTFYFDNDEQPYRIKHDKELGKVLRKMKSPEAYKDLKPMPLACLWSAVHHSGDPDPFFNVAVEPNSPDDAYDSLTVFSVSTYLRNMVKETKQSITLDLPHLRARMNLLAQLFSPGEPMNQDGESRRTTAKGSSPA